MQIRTANLADLNVCMGIDDSFETEYVWQMEERSGAGDISVAFRLARLPRPMKVSGVISRDDVAFNFQHGGTLLVAEDGKIFGYIDVTTSLWNQSMYINNIAVASAYRRKGVGSMLLRTALEWGRHQNLRSAMLDTSTKDYPAICFYQKHGFSFCGFNDQLYPNRDIALYYSVNLR